MTFPMYPKKFNLLLFTLLFTGSLLAQTAVRNIDESFDAKEEVSLRQSHGPLVVLPSTDGKIRVVTRISVDADDKADADEFLRKLDVDLTETSGSLDVRVAFSPVKSWHQNNRNTRVVFKDGTRLKNIQNFELETTLYLPATKRLRLKTRFEDIRIDEQVPLQDVYVDLHNANLRGGDVKGELRAEMRFGSLDLGNVAGPVSGSIHNVTFEVGNAGAVKLESRFSKMEFGNVASLDFNGHNDRLKVAGVEGDLEIDDRFGTYFFGMTKDAEIDSHNGTFDIDSGNNYQVKGRFVKFDIESLKELDLEGNHNSEFDIESLGSVKGDGRFTTVDVDKLITSADLELNNGKLFVDELAPTFTKIEVDGSFFEVDLEFAAKTDYHVSASLNFGKVDAPRELTVTDREEDHGRLRYEASTAGAGESSPTIRVKGHNGQLRID